MKLQIALSITMFVLSVAGISGNARAEEANTIYMDETYISGNQELPKVLYILPWKNQEGEAVPAMNPILINERVMAPIYPHEYRLEMSYRALIADRTSETDKHTQSTLGKSISRNKSKEE